MTSSKTRRPLIPWIALIAAVALGAATVQAINTGSKDDEGDGEKNPEATALYNEGVKLAEAGKYEEARQKFEKAAKEEKDDPEILNMLAFTQRKTGRLDDAFRNYRRALEIKPAFPQAREYLGEAHVQAALQEVEILRGYGPEGAAELADLVSALQEAATTASGGEARRASHGSVWK